MNKHMFKCVLMCICVICLGLGSVGFAHADQVPQSLQNFIADARWSNGITWNGSQQPKIASFSSWGCCAYCADYVKYCYGINNPRAGTVFYDLYEARAGDVITLGNQSDGTGHWLICLCRSGNSLYVAEGNLAYKVRIGWNYSIKNGAYFNEDSRVFTAGYHFLDPQPETGTIDVNTILDGVDTGSGTVMNGVRYGTFDVYINGSLTANDADDIGPTACTSYSITDIKPTAGHIYAGSVGALSGNVAAGQTVTVKLKFYSQYTISYNANGGSGAPGSQTKTYGTALTLSSTRPTRTGYAFQGWATSASATSAAYQPGGSYTSNSAATLYAVWKPQTYTVTLNANGGTVSPSSVSVTYNSTYGSLPEPNRSGYIFDGWYSASSGGSKVTSSTRVTATGNHTLYAHWREIAKLYLPASLKRIEDEAFTGSSAMVVGIPDGCEYIGSKAFANCANLMCVFFPNNDMIIKPDAFSGCSKVMFCCYKDSSAQVYAEGKKIPYVLRSDDWVLAENVPVGATIVGEKWTYTRTTTSTASSMAGWEQNGFTWQQTGTGTHQYASYPSGFDTSHALYSKYAKSALSSSASGNTKREVSDASWKNFIYWHWANPTNRRINNVRGVSDDGFDFCQFCAFETTADYEHKAPNGHIDPDCFATEDYGCAYSWWWWRFDVYQQTYTDYRKLFTYRKTEESSSLVSEGNGISNVKHWVKYSF